MRKKLLLAFFTLLGAMLLWCGVANAATYYGDTYQITIPDGEYEVEAFANELEATCFPNSEKMFLLQSQENSSTAVCDETFLELMLEYYEESYPNFKLIDSKVFESNACFTSQIQYRDLISGEYVYVDSYMYKSDNYLYTLMFMTTDRSYLSSTEKANIVNSFKIKDTVTSSYGLPFTDVATNSWYYSAVKYNYQNNMIKGLNDYTFGPSKNLTRGMLVTILHRMEGSPSVSGASKFSDVQNTKDYYYTAVKWATQNNIISGYNSGKFGPNDPITREQLAVILSKYSKFKGKYKASTASLSSFKDASKVSSFAETGMQWAVGNGVITGNASSKTLNPQGTTTRAEAASMLYKYCLNVK